MLTFKYMCAFLVFGLVPAMQTFAASGESS